jgi:anaerobic ribonucleoside-triphosphate reductase
MNHVVSEVKNKSAVIPVLAYSRVSGYYNPTVQFNKGKAAEFAERKYYKIPEGIKNEKI